MNIFCKVVCSSQTNGVKSIMMQDLVINILQACKTFMTKSFIWWICKRVVPPLFSLKDYSGIPCCLGQTFFCLLVFFQWLLIFALVEFWSHGCIFAGAKKIDAEKLNIYSQNVGSPPTGRSPDQSAVSSPVKTSLGKAASPTVLPPLMVDKWGRVVPGWSPYVKASARSVCGTLWSSVSTLTAETGKKKSTLNRRFDCKTRFMFLCPTSGVPTPHGFAP